MNKKSKYIFVFFEIVLTLTLSFNLYFHNGNKFYRILLTMLTVCAVSIPFMKIRKYNTVYFLILVFIFFSMYVGNILNIYKLIYFYDKVLHFISGSIISIIAVRIFMNYHDIYDKKNFTFIFIVSFSIACAGIWEIYEYTTDVLFNFNSQNASLNDTMQDIICGTLGSLICFLPKVSFFDKHNIIIKTLLNEKK